jgi:hypothetical protein
LAFNAGLAANEAGEINAQRGTDYADHIISENVDETGPEAAVS